MKIYLVRHGESESDTKLKYEGDYDDALTAKGFEDACRVAGFFVDKNIKGIVTSSRVRAVQTAEVIAQTLQLPLEITTDLKEQDIYGAFKDLHINQPEEEYRLLGEINVSQANTVPGVEPYEDFAARVMKQFNKIVSTANQNLVIITHGGPIRCLLRTHFPDVAIPKLGNGAIVTLERVGEEGPTKAQLPALRLLAIN